MSPLVMPGQDLSVVADGFVPGKGYVVAVRNVELLNGDKAVVRFYRNPHGSPEGQIKAYQVRELAEDHVGEVSGERRMLANELPSLELRQLFVKLTGKTADEIGVQLHQLN